MIAKGMACIGVLLGLFAVSAAQASTYYVRNGGDDNADGRSHASAWATLGRVNKFEFAPGDRVLLHEGHRWEERLIVDWSGTEKLPVIIGSYYVENGTQAWGFRIARPIIDGADRLPGHPYDAMIRVQGDYVRLENLEVRRSSGRAIAFQEADHGKVVRSVTDGAYKSGINFLRSDDGVVRQNVVSHAGLAYPRDNATWAGAIEFVDSDRGYITQNTVVEVYGEGINANHGSTGTVIEKNIVYAARSAGIYADAAPDTVIRRNIVVGTSDSTYWRTDRSVGAGIALNNEKYHYQDNGGTLLPSVQSANAEIYCNLVAFTSSGLAFWGALDGTRHEGTLVFNNTFVDNNVQLSALSTPKPGSRFVNNVLLSLSPGTKDVDTTNLAGMIAKSNYLSQGDPGGDLSHPGNQYRGLLLEKQTNWRAIYGLTDVEWRNFIAVAGSATIGAGDDEPLEMAQGSASFNQDFNGLEFVSPMDMGALRYTESPFKRPKRPQSVTWSR